MAVNKDSKEKLILFETTEQTIIGKRDLTPRELNYRMAAVPPEISTDCGSAITVTAELEKLKKLFEEENILVEAVYELKKENRKKEYKKIYSRS